MYVAERSCESQSLSHCLDDDALGPPTVPFSIKNALPGTEVEPAIGDRNDHLVADRQRPEMRSGIVFPSAAVMAISVGIPRRDVALQPVENVLPESRLVVVDKDGGRDVHGRHEYHPLANS